MKEIANDNLPLVHAAFTKDEIQLLYDCVSAVDGRGTGLKKAGDYQKLPYLLGILDSLIKYLN